MKFLPYENIIYKTRLRQDEVIRRLAENLEPRKSRNSLFGDRGPAKTYEGEIAGSTFHIQRIIYQRNSWLPVISGVVEKEPDGTVIKLKMQLSIFVIIFSCLWCGGVLIGCVFAACNMFTASGFRPVLLGPFAMLVLFYAMTMIFFKRESIRSKKDLRQLFEAEILQE
jgi:hypothetical protein